MLDQLTTNRLNILFPSINFEKFLSEGGQKKVYKGKKGGQDIVIKIIPIDNNNFYIRITY